MYNTIIIEDDPMVMDINCSYISKCSKIRIVATFKNGREALEYILAGNPVDLVILDVYMPEMNGIEFLHNLRTSGNSCHVIPVTAANERENVAKILKYNVTDYLVKPFGESRLLQAINKFLTCKEISNKIPPVSQGELDEIFNPQTQKEEKREKPIDPRTLEIISSYMKKSKNKAIPIKDIAETVKLSPVTVRRYLNHLKNEGIVTTRLNYSTGGKPAVLYIYK